MLRKIGHTDIFFEKIGNFILNFLVYLNKYFYSENIDCGYSYKDEESGDMGIGNKFQPRIRQTTVVAK